MELIPILVLLVKLCSGLDPHRLETPDSSVISSPMSFFLSENLCSPKSSEATRQYLDKDTATFENFPDPVSFISLRMIFLVILTSLSGVLGFRFGFKKEEGRVTVDPSPNCLNSPFSSGSTLFSSMQSPETNTELFPCHPFPSLFSHQTFDYLNDMGAYKKNFIEEEVLLDLPNEKTYLARHRLDNSLYLVKAYLLSISLLDSLDDKPLFKEIKKVSNVSCRHVTRYVTCWVESEEIELVSMNSKVLLYVQMEYIEGVPLSKWLENDFDPKTAVKVLKKVGKVIRHLHGKGIPHGDISLGNIFLDSYKCVTVGDFNFSNSCEDDLKNYNQIIETILKLLAPEDELLRKELLLQVMSE